MPKSQADRALALLLLLAFAGFTYTIHDVFEEKIIQAGDRAPSFSITTDSGKVITQSSFGGKVLVLNFWATWCPPCISELPSLSAMAEQLKPEGVVVLGVSIDKNQQAYKRFLRQARPAFETAQDPEANISTQFGTFKWPETYVIDRNGKVAQKYISDRDWTSPEIVANLRSLL